MAKKRTKRHYISFMKNGLLKRKYFFSYSSASKWGKKNLSSFRNERIKYKPKK